MSLPAVRASSSFQPPVCPSHHSALTTWGRSSGSTSKHRHCRTGSFGLYPYEWKLGLLVHHTAHENSLKWTYPALHIITQCCVLNVPIYSCVTFLYFITLQFLAAASDFGGTSKFVLFPEPFSTNLNEQLIKQSIVMFWIREKYPMKWGLYFGIVHMVSDQSLDFVLTLE